MRAGFWIGTVVIAAALFLLASSTTMQSALGAAATSFVRPIAIPLVELINVPAFVYCAALVILLAGFAACGLYQFAVLRPYLFGLRRLRSSLGDLPQPRVSGPTTMEAWIEARHALGLLLQRDGVFVAGWSAFQAEALRERGVPGRPFSSFVAAEPSDAVEPGAFMRSLPGYFTSVGLILTFIGLVVALYFAAKGFRSGDNAQAKLAIIQLLNAASFKFLTSVSALISALLVSLYGRYGAAAIGRERQRTLERIEGYLASWRERVGAGKGADVLAPADLLRRFDALLAGVAGLAEDVRRLAERDAGGHPAARSA